MTQEFISLERRKIVKRAVASLGLGWSLARVRKDPRMGIWNLSLEPESMADEESTEETPDKPSIPVVLGDAEMDGLEQGGPAGDRALAKIRKAVQLRTKS